MKVFQVGFGKCGTSSLHQFFLNSGYRSIHWGGGELAKSISRNVNNRNYILDGLDDYDFYTDTKEINDFIAKYSEKIQCVVSNSDLPFGSTQSPDLSDYADGIYTISFLKDI